MFILPGLPGMGVMHWHQLDARVGVGPVAAALQTRKHGPELALVPDANVRYDRPVANTLHDT